MLILFRINMFSIFKKKKAWKNVRTVAQAACVTMCGCVRHGLFNQKNIIHISYNIRQTTAAIMTWAVIMKLHTSCLVLLFTTRRANVITCHNLNGTVQTTSVKPLWTEISSNTVPVCLNEHEAHDKICDNPQNQTDHPGDSFHTRPAHLN